jgi:hypothetical protein
MLANARRPRGREIMTQDNEQFRVPAGDPLPPPIALPFATNVAPPSGATDEGAVVVQYQLTSDDVIPALRRELLRNNRMRLTFVCGVVLIVCGAALVLDPGTRSFGGFCLYVALFYVVLIGTALGLGPRRAWRRNPVLRGPQYMAFFADGIYARSTVSEARSRWSLYGGLIETNRCYMLRLATRRAYVFVPKRAFASAHDEAVFQQLAAQHIRGYVPSLTYG